MELFLQNYSQINDSIVCYKREGTDVVSCEAVKTSQRASNESHTTDSSAKAEVCRAGF